MRVIDLGAGDNPDSRATETVDLYTEATHQFDLEERWELESDSVDGLIANHVLEHIDTEHFFNEAARVLVDSGWLEITVPVGRDAKADPDHNMEWTYWTPKMFCRDHREKEDRPWDMETKFELVSRDIEVWLLGPFSPFSGVFNRVATYWPHWGVRRCGSGALTASYERIERST